MGTSGSRDQHFNLPNFDISPQLSYHDDDDGHIKGSNSIQIPDATIGLYTYDLNKKPWVDRKDLIDNDRVKLFDKKALSDCLKSFELEGPYWQNSSKCDLSNVRLRIVGSEKVNFRESFPDTSSNCQIISHTATLATQNLR